LGPPKYTSALNKNAGYCYHSVYVITFGLVPSDFIKWFKILNLFLSIECQSVDFLGPLGYRYRKIQDSDTNTEDTENTEKPTFFLFKHCLSYYWIEFLAF